MRLASGNPCFQAWGLPPSSRPCWRRVTESTYRGPLDSDVSRLNSLAEFAARSATLDEESIRSVRYWYTLFWVRPVLDNRTWIDGAGYPTGYSIAILSWTLWMQDRLRRTLPRFESIERLAHLRSLLA